MDGDLEWSWTSLKRYKRVMILDAKVELCTGMQRCRGGMFSGMFYGKSWEGFRSRDLAGRTIGDQRGSPVDGEVVWW